jgi:hypothetical protein
LRAYLVIHSADSTRGQHAAAIIQSYVVYLSSIGATDLIAYYVSLFPDLYTVHHTRKALVCISTYATFLMRYAAFRCVIFVSVLFFSFVLFYLFVCLFIYLFCCFFFFCLLLFVCFFLFVLILFLLLFHQLFLLSFFCLFVLLLLVGGGLLCSDPAVIGRERDLLRLAADYGLDCTAITAHIVEHICDVPLPDHLSEEQILQFDNSLIEQLKWLSYDLNQSFEIIKQSNKLIRKFICMIFVYLSFFIC